MAKIKSPGLFSMRFGVEPETLAELGVLDSFLNADTRLFIDPLLLQVSGHSIFAENAYECFEKYFSDVIRLLRASKGQGDLPWRNADRLFNFREIKETCIGYGGNSIHGSAIGPTLRARLMSTAKQIVDLGIEDPELFALLGLLEDDIGADRISDMTTRAILPAIIEFNASLLKKLKVPTSDVEVAGIPANLPINPYETTPTGILLLPVDILRDLPIANDWQDVADAAEKNQALRDDLNSRIGNIWAIRTREDKAVARHAVLEDKQSFEKLMEAIGLTDKLPYDAAADMDGHFIWRAVLARIAEEFPLKLDAPKEESVNEIELVVAQIIEHFTKLIEHNGLSELLWHDGKPRHEKSAQKLFFAVADAYCKANNLDINPEVDPGGGPVDFKLSSGYEGRSLVEIKLSTGKVVHGYTTQLEVYKDASETCSATFLVIDVGKMGRKLETIFKKRNASITAGEPASKIVVVDGEIKPSASIR